MASTNVQLVSVGTALPGPPVTNADLARRFGMDRLWEQWVEHFIGTRTRHLAVDLHTGDVPLWLADLAERAARDALRTAGVQPSEVDLMVFGTATSDKLMPATVNVVADRLGIDGVPTYQLQSGCSGAFQALDVATQLLSTGRYRHALAIGGDVCAKHFDLTADLRALPPDQLVNVVLFGDGAGAALLSAEPAADAVLLRHVFTRLTGLNRPAGQTLDWFGLADTGPDRTAAVEDYKAIEESVPRMASEILDELLDETGWSRADLTYLLPPQLSGRMTARIAERLAVPDAKEVTCVSETGNTGNALPFLQLERILGTMSAGERALGIAVESSKWIKAGFALEKV